MLSAPAIYIAACTMLTFAATFFMPRVDRGLAVSLSPSATSTAAFGAEQSAEIAFLR